MKIIHKRLKTEAGHEFDPIMRCIKEEYPNHTFTSITVYDPNTFIPKKFLIIDGRQTRVYWGAGLVQDWDYLPINFKLEILAQLYGEIDVII